MKLSLLLLLLVSSMVSLESCSHAPSTHQPESTLDAQPQTNPNPPSQEVSTKKIVAPQPLDWTTNAQGLTSKILIRIKTTKGTLGFRLYADDAPKTAHRMIELAQQGFFNGLAFHRVVPNFVVQSGDPLSKNLADPLVGTGGSGQSLKAEFNNRLHVRGAVAMARSNDPDSADSQFYICLGSLPFLDHSYTVFGQTVEFGPKVGGRDVLDRIEKGDRILKMSIKQD